MDRNLKEMYVCYVQIRKVFNHVIPSTCKLRKFVCGIKIAIQSRSWMECLSGVAFEARVH